MQHGIFLWCRWVEFIKAAKSINFLTLLIILTRICKVILGNQNHVNFIVTIHGGPFKSMIKYKDLLSNFPISLE